MCILTTPELVYAGTSLWINGDRRAATCNVDSYGVFPYGLWHVQAKPTQWQSPEPPKPIMHCSRASIPRKHGLEAETYQDQGICPQCRQINALVFIPSSKSSQILLVHIYILSSFLNLFHLLYWSQRVDTVVDKKGAEHSLNVHRKGIGLHYSQSTVNMSQRLSVKS